MYSAFHKLKGAVTLFHAPKSAISNSLVNYIKTKFPKATQSDFTVDITESVPTPEQWRIIAHSKSLQGSSQGAPEARSIIEEASKLGGFEDKSKAEVDHSGVISKVIKINKYPILVDWDTGKVAIDNEAQAKEILQAKFD
ncbi:uncharacterized protein SAPINGB_P000683 [Magnusiomyces paraingens]|uniref:Thioredoxin-like fold domain-containing protein n=1 Tax=Magnusiomyces paraingens TaxID=2606893 RepID=A0A5E8B7M0_9ASCO|nr:uncharacterized protein SAPINGB_P000683 [Saprochaete ingens]VVT45237.1 unnamed protein product [Saprochaete ingens]